MEDITFEVGRKFERVLIAIALVAAITLALAGSMEKAHTHIATHTSIQVATWGSDTTAWKGWGR